MKTTNETGKSNTPQIKNTLPFTGISGSCQQSRSEATKAYIRALRQAEMMAWNQSGGDCLLSSSLRNG